MQSIEKEKHPYFFFGFYWLICLPALIIFIFLWLVNANVSRLLERLPEGLIFILIPAGLKIIEGAWRISATRLVQLLARLLAVGLLVLWGLIINFYASSLIGLLIMVDVFSAPVWCLSLLFIVSSKSQRNLAGLKNLGKVGVFVLLLIVFVIGGNTMGLILCTLVIVLYALLSAWWFLPKAVQKVDLEGERV